MMTSVDEKIASDKWISDTPITVDFNASLAGTLETMAKSSSADESLSLLQKLADFLCRNGLAKIESLKGLAVL